VPCGTESRWLCRRQLDDTASGRCDLRNPCGERFKAGVFTVHSIRVSTVCDCVALAIHTPSVSYPHATQGRSTPTDNHSSSAFLCGIRQAGVLALFSGLDNVERKGYTPSEARCGANLTKFSRTPNAACSFHVFFFHSTGPAAWNGHQHGRKVAFVGRSMNNSAKSRKISAIWKFRRAPNQSGEMRISRGKNLRMISGTQRAHVASRVQPSITTTRQDRERRYGGRSSHIPARETIYRMIDHLFRGGVRSFHETVLRRRFSQRHASRKN